MASLTLAIPSKGRLKDDCNAYFADAGAVQVSNQPSLAYENLGAGSVTFAGGGGTDELIIDRTGDALADTVTISDTAVTSTRTLTAPLSSS